MKKIKRVKIPKTYFIEVEKLPEANEVLKQFGIDPSFPYEIGEETEDFIVLQDKQHALPDDRVPAKRND